MRCLWISWDLQLFPVSPPKNTHIKWPSNLPKTPLRPPESAVDGDLETYWATETGYPSAEFHLDLGSSQLIMVWESQVESDWWVKMVDMTCPEMNRNWMSWDFLFFFQFVGWCFFFSGFLVVWSVSRNRWSFRRFLSKTIHHCEASISKKERKNNLKNKHKFCNMFWFFCEEHAFVSCFYFFTFLQPQKICGSAAPILICSLSLWSLPRPEATKVSWRYRPETVALAIFFVTETRWEDEGNLNKSHFRIDIDSGWWRAIIDSVDISWHGWIPIDDIIAKVFVFGPLDHEVLIDAGHILRYSQA